MHSLGAGPVEALFVVELVFAPGFDRRQIVDDGDQTR